jgi:hypothetical protein
VEGSAQRARTHEEAAGIKEIGSIEGWMEQKSRSKWWHHIVALITGYLAASFTYALFDLYVVVLLIGKLSAATLSGVQALATIAIGLLVYLSCIRGLRTGG